MIVRGYTPKKWQRVVHDILQKCEGKVDNPILLVKSKRQCGKSVMATQLILEYTLKNERQKSIYISPTLKQSRKVFKDIADGLRDARGLIVSANASLLEYRFCNGSEIVFLSAEQKESLRGYTISEKGILIVDEGAYIPDDVWAIFTPFTNVFRRPMIVISTPRYCTGMFYDLWKSSDRNVFRIDWNEYDTSEFLSADILAFYRKTLPRSQFVMDYEGKFASLTSDLFGDIVGVVEENPEKTGRYYCGVDWGTGRGGDYTAVVMFNERSQMVYCEQWNDCDETATIERIIEILKDWRPLKVTCELNSIGNVFFGLLEKAIRNNGIDTELNGFLTTNESKNDIVQAMQVAVQNKEVSFLNNSDLLEEFSAYAVEVTRGGKVTYNASVGHDDYVMATLIAFSSLSNGVYYVGQ